MTKKLKPLPRRRRIHVKGWSDVDEWETRNFWMRIYELSMDGPIEAKIMASGAVHDYEEFLRNRKKNEK